MLHGSYVEYVGWRWTLNMPILMFGKRCLTRCEVDRRLKMGLLERAGNTNIVKLGGARGWVIMRIS